MVNDPSELLDSYNGEGMGAYEPEPSLEPQQGSVISDLSVDKYIDMPPIFTPGWHQSLPDHRDYDLAKFHPELLRIKADPSVDLAERFPGQRPITNQGNLGSCTAFASLRAFVYACLRGGTTFLDGSELMQYYFTRQKLGQQYINIDSGGYMRDAFKVMAEKGVAVEALWPYNISRFRDAPPQTAVLDAAQRQIIKYYSVPNDVDAIQSVLTAGWPVVTCFTVFSNYSQSTVDGRWPEASGSVLGGHCHCTEGYNVKYQGYWKDAGSWGASAFDRGFHYQTFNYKLRNGSDYWTVEVIEGAQPEPTPTPTPTPTDRATKLTVDYLSGATKQLTL